MKTMIKMLWILQGLCLQVMAQTGEIRGQVKDEEGELVPYAVVRVLQGNLLVAGARADLEGAYSVKALTPGVYEILVSGEGYISQPIHRIKVVPNEATYVDPILKVNSIGGVTVVAEPIIYNPAGVDKSMFSVQHLDYKELSTNSGYTSGDVKGALSVITSNVIESADGQIHFRGGRGDANAYFVDGVRTLSEIRVPGLAIEQLTVFSGGVPAMYGDVTSGVVIVTTKSYFSGIRDKNMRLTAQE